MAGSFLEGAPIVPVSSVTGAGLDELRQRAGARGRAACREKNAAGHFRLPIDRVFSVKGFGTVVTGTLISGVGRARSRRWRSIPAGRRLRVRGVQVHGSQAGPRGGRAAHRGQPGRYRAGRAGARRRALRARACSAPCKQLDCRLRPAAFGQAAEAPRAGALSFRHGGDRSRGAAARTARRRCSRAARPTPGWCCASRRCCCPATASSSACSRRW